MELFIFKEVGEFGMGGMGWDGLYRIKIFLKGNRVRVKMLGRGKIFYWEFLES